MPKPVTLYRVFVASPGDCLKEREIIRQAVTNWNATQGYWHSVTLEAVLWESHAFPALGDRPQAIINRQILDSCDLLVGVFKGRIGSPTGMAPSGTLEEIDRFQQAGKPTMVYFSRATKPATTENTQNVDAIRSRLEKVGLIWTYRGLVEFSSFITNHLSHAMSRLVALPSEPLMDPPPEIEGYGGVRRTTTDSLVDAVLEIKGNTTLLWQELCFLKDSQTEISCEIREVSLNRVRPALDHLSNEGFFSFSTEFVYALESSEIPVYMIKLENIALEFRFLIHEAMIDQDDLPRINRTEASQETPTK